MFWSPALITTESELDGHWNSTSFESRSLAEKLYSLKVASQIHHYNNLCSWIQTQSLLCHILYYMLGQFLFQFQFKTHLGLSDKLMSQCSCIYLHDGLCQWWCLLCRLYYCSKDNSGLIQWCSNSEVPSPCTHQLVCKCTF